MRDRAHASGLIVDHGLADLIFGVHHERAVTHDRLLQRHPAEQQYFERLAPALSVTDSPSFWNTTIFCASIS